jgi:hypothetical protein
MPIRPRNPAGYVRKPPDTATLCWQGIVQYPDPDRPGRWKQRSKTFARKAEAQQWVDQALAEHRRTPTYRPPTDMTVEAYLAQWLDMTRQRVRPSTHESCGYRVKDVVEA